MGKIVINDARMGAKVHDISAVFEKMLPKSIPGFYFRKAQAELSEQVDKVMQGGGTLIAEAGTGTGKSGAYIVPMLLAPYGSFIISTNTIALQEQLVKKDIPQLAAALGKSNVKVEIAKGASNYLCKLSYRKWKSASESPDAAFVRWADKTGSGDFSQFGKALGRELSELSAEACIGSACPYFRSCFKKNADDRIRGADIIVTNHAYLLANFAAMGGHSPLAGTRHIVIDEAHNLPSVAVNAFSVSVTQGRMNKLFTKFSKFEGFQADEAQAAADSFWASIVVGTGGRVGLDQFDRASAGLLYKMLTKLAKDVRAYYREFDEEYGTNEEDSARAELDIAQIDDMALNLAFILNFDPNFVAWADSHTVGQTEYKSINASPIDPSKFLHRLFASYEGKVFMSATLKPFDYFSSTVGIKLYNTFEAESPFDYKKHMLIVVPTNLPDVKSSTFHADTSGIIIKAISQSGGRSMVLTTSIRGMNEVYRVLTSALGRSYTVMKQGDGSPQKLVESLKGNPKSVIVATRSFWEGIDIKGDSLSCLIIDKIPYPIFGDPIIQARMKKMEEEGVNPYLKLMVPEAQSMFRQGVGRLIRSKDDHGVVVVLDSRLMEPDTNRRFLGALPGFTFTRNVDDIGAWLKSL